MKLDSFSCYRFFCLLAALLFLCGCSDQHRKHQENYKVWIESNGKVKVLSTTGIINDIVREIGGDYVDALALIKGDLDPHSYQLVKGDDEKLAFAAIIFYNGLGLEHGPSLQHYLSQNPKAISLGDRLKEIDSSRVIYVNGQQDPHIWMDISLWAETVPIIAEALAKLDPDHAKQYQENGLKLRKKMAEAHHRARTLMQEVRQEKRYLVTSHDAFNYFTRAYLSEEGEVESGEWVKRFAAPEGLAPESQLSVMDISNIIDHLRQYHIQQLIS